MLPRELIEEIKYFTQVPSIDIKKDEYVVYFEIKYYSMTARLNTSVTIKTNYSDFSYIYDEYHKPDHLCYPDDGDLNRFIKKLTKNKDCRYDESYYYECVPVPAFQIDVTGDTIKIGDDTITIDLPNNGKNILLTALKKYQAML